MNFSLQNSNPQVFEKSGCRILNDTAENDEVADIIDSLEIFDAIKNIRDPEHPLSLEELNVVRQDQIVVDNVNSDVVVHFSPTVPHCSMATLIGLSIRVLLIRVLPPRLKVAVLVAPGTHASESAVNKQLNDKERVSAAMENTQMMELINQCIGESLLAQAE